MLDFHASRTFYIWRRKRDLNPRDPFEPYSLSRGAPSPLGYFSVVNAQSDDKCGGEGGIRTHGALLHHQFSRLAP